MEDDWDENWEDNEDSYITIQSIVFSLTWKDSLEPRDSFDTCSDEENEKSTPELTEEEKYYTTTGIKPNLPLYQQNKGISPPQIVDGSRSTSGTSWCIYAE